MTDAEAKLIAQIGNAFAGVTLDDGISLNMTEFLDSYGCSAEFEEQAKFDERNDWSAISDETLEKFTVTFSFTDIAGYRFYLPAYMIWTLKHHRTNDSIIADFTIYALDVNTYQFENRSFVDVFTPEQLDCIAEFLQYCVDNGDTLDDETAFQHLYKLLELRKPEVKSGD
jgi:hypothetical protein